jgi:hypothetical protein
MSYGTVQAAEIRTLVLRLATENLLIDATIAHAKADLELRRPHRLAVAVPHPTAGEVEARPAKSG